MAYPSNGDSVAKDQLLAFVERVERMHEERKAIADDIKEIYAEAKGNGFDVPALKTVIKIRGQDHVERMEREALVELYLVTLGMEVAPDDDSVPARAPAHVETIGQFNTEPEAMPRKIGEAEQETASLSDTQSHAVVALLTVADDGSTTSPAGVEGDADRQPIPLGDEGSRPQKPSGGVEPQGGGSAEATAPDQDESARIAPAQSTAAPSNVISIKPFHGIISSTGLKRQHGCKNPDLCGSMSPMKHRCGPCQIAWDAREITPGGTAIEHQGAVQ